MKHGRLGKITFTLLLGALFVGGAAAENVSRLHWLGQRQICAEPGAARVRALWNLPETARLEAQTLAKFAGGTNAPLRALLDDVVREEFYAEVRHEANQPGSAVFAIRLNAERAKLWEANRATLPSGVELQRAGDWTLLGKATGANPLLAEWRERIAKTGAPAARGATNFWLEADADLPAVARALGWKWDLPAGWPRIFLTLTGDGENVLTRGSLKFAQPLALPLEAWNIPTNLIRDPLIGFTAVRGLGGLPRGLTGWDKLEIGAAPGQLFLWAQAAVPFQNYFAGLFADAPERMRRISERLLTQGNEWVVPNHVGNFARADDGRGVLWKSAPFMSPFVQVVGKEPKGFVFGGLFTVAGARTNAAMPAELVKQVLGAPDLVMYDWELTGPRIEGWLHIGQLFRVIGHKAQLPPKSAGLEWLRAAAPKLGNNVTTVTRADAAQLAFNRKSTCGFTALELHLLADWLESPDFPAGLHTSRTPAAAFDAKGKLPRPAAPKP
ncbi:MAG: hypothetical protein NTZ16_14155 [Verrucomicrobia bacterium]|nr:hypothetical protein [Verrucomicrobiota bacterium]